MMLRYSFGQAAEADLVEQAVADALASGKRTGDIMSAGCEQVGTDGMTKAVLDALDALMHRWSAREGEKNMEPIMGYVAVVGATGAVGREMLKLWPNGLSGGKGDALASSNSAGREVSYGEDDVIKVQSLDSFDFTNADIALFSAGGIPPKPMPQRQGRPGCMVIDNSSAFRMDEDVPLIVPEVNPDTVTGQLKENGGRNIIANPNCSTAQLVVALKPLHEAYGVRRVVVSTYQATSGAGRPAMDELFNQTKGIFVNDR